MERDNQMHGARSALNRDMDMRAWCENYLKEKARTDKPEMTEDEFEHFWKYHKPEIMHEGAAEAAAAFREQNPRG
jgi:hypothetical protein